MKLFFLLAAATSLLLSSCSTYPFGHSRNGNYYGGQGMAISPGQHVPREAQRSQEIF